MSRARREIAAAALALSFLASCGGQVPLTAPEGATLTIEANPKSIPTVGGRSTITVIGFKAAEDGGGTLSDGTQIFFTTDLGAIEERVEMENGIARATLQSDGRSGTATVTASSGGGITAVPTTVQIGAGTEGDIVITVIANPTTLGPEDLTSEIIATVTDNRGNALPDVPVIFSTDSGALASQGSILRTNVSGQAFDRLTLLDDVDSAQVTVTSGSTTASVTVTRGDFGDPLIDSISPSSGSPGETLSVTITGQNFQPGATVSFGEGIGVNDVIFVNSETLIASITIDPGAQTTGVGRTVTVTNPDGGSGSLSDAFRVGDLDPPIILSISPTSSPDRSPTTVIVTITGTDFQPGAVVGFSPSGVAVNSTTFLSSTQIRVVIEVDVIPTVPAGTQFDVTVINPDGGTDTFSNGYTAN
jgi:hypothetical protein